MIDKIIKFLGGYTEKEYRALKHTNGLLECRLSVMRNQLEETRTLLYSSTKNCNNREV